MTTLQLIKRTCYQVAYPVLWFGVITTRKRLRGVRVMIVSADKILLVRHTYSDRGRWLLPGGSVKRYEDLAAAAAREVSEEVGINIRPVPLGAYGFKRFGVDITNHGFWAEAAAGAVIRRDPVELAAANWFVLDELPTLAPGIAEIIAMYRELVKKG